MTYLFASRDRNDDSASSDKKASEFTSNLLYIKVISIVNSTCPISTLRSTPNKLGSSSNGIKKQSAGTLPSVVPDAAMLVI